MHDDVELLVNARLGPDEVTSIQQELRDWGWQPQVRRMPARRGAAEFTWLLLLTVPAEIIAKTMLEHLGTKAYEVLRDFVQRRFGRATPAEASDPAKRVVVMESAGTGAQFALDADLPVDAYRQMVDLFADDRAGNGLHNFDRRQNRWVPA